MSEPFIGEVKLFANSYAPRGWALCNGQILPINTNQALYSLIGTTYGGDGVTNFALPDLRGRVPIHTGAGIPLGQSAGEEQHTLTIQELPNHTHQVHASTNPANAPSPLNNAWAAQPGQYQAASGTLSQMNTGAISSAGNSQPHNNMQPFLVLNYCIAVQGIFPSRN